jgi:hypothetical protein
LNRLISIQDLKAILDNGSDLPFPDGLIINGRGSNAYTFNVDQGTLQKLQPFCFLED